MRYYIAVCVLVGAYSVSTYFAEVNLGWAVESLGFAWGMLLSRAFATLKKAFVKCYWGKLICLSAVSLALGLLYLHCKPVFFWGEYLCRLVLGLTLIGWVLCVTYRFRLGNRVSLYLGKCSYEIFLWHGFVMDLLILLDEALDGISLSSGLFSVLTFGLTIGLAAAMHCIDGKIAGLIKRDRKRSN